MPFAPARVASDCPDLPCYGRRARNEFSRLNRIVDRPGAGGQETYRFPAAPALAKSQSVMVPPSAVAKHRSKSGRGEGVSPVPALAEHDSGRAVGRAVAEGQARPQRLRARDQLLGGELPRPGTRSRYGVRSRSRNVWSIAGFAEGATSNQVRRFAASRSLIGPPKSNSAQKSRASATVPPASLLRAHRRLPTARHVARKAPSIGGITRWIMSAWSLRR
jgi:hypothetical protein